MVVLPGLRYVASKATVKVATAAAAVVASLTFANMDANPSLFFFDESLGRQRAAASSTPETENVTASGPPNPVIMKAFQNSTVLITGSTSGIGKELVFRLSQLGTVKNLILLGGRTSKLDEVGEECRLIVDKEWTRDGGEHSEDDAKEKFTISEGKTRIWTIPLDMRATISSSPSSAVSNDLEVAIDQVEEIVTRDKCKLDLVILNAGIGQQQLARSTTSFSTQEIFQVNTLAPIAICQALLDRNLVQTAGDQKNMPGLSNDNCERGSGSIVVTSSIAALTSVPLSSSYAASKAAVQSYFRTLQAEENVKVSLICPGPVDTDFFLSIPSNNITGVGVGKAGKAAEKPMMIDQSKLQEDSHPTNKENSQQLEDGLEHTRQSTTLKMSISRCVQLYMSCLTMTLVNDIDKDSTLREHWIAEQPTLFALYINQVCPSAFQWFIATVVAKARIKAWKEGKDLYDPQTWKGSMRPRWWYTRRDENE